MSGLQSGVVKPTSTNQSKYSDVVCLAYECATGKFDTRKFSTFWDGKKWQIGGIVAYDKGGVSDRAHAIARIGFMKEAIEYAYHAYRAFAVAKGFNPLTDEKTLKIFMAPEFYFRGPSGAYEMDQATYILETLRSEKTKEARFKNWLFVFGTVIAASYDDELFCDKCGQKDKLRRVGDKKWVCDRPGCDKSTVSERRLGAIIDNIALIQKGGESDYRNCHYVQKEYISHIDFRRATGKKELEKGKILTGYDKVAKFDDWDKNRTIILGKKKIKALATPGSRDIGGGGGKGPVDERGAGGAIFTVDGLKFGLEICLDHLKARLAPSTGLQVQLVPSAGAFLKQFACVKGGVAFNVDGGGKRGKSDVRVNDKGTVPSNSTEPAHTDYPIPDKLGGGNIRIYDGQPLPG